MQIPKNGSIWGYKNDSENKLIFIHHPHTNLYTLINLEIDGLWEDCAGFDNTIWAPLEDFAFDKMEEIA